MRYVTIMAATAAFVAAPAAAADELKFGQAPSWVIPVAVPPAPKVSTEAPVLLLLSDQQIRLEPGKVTTFTQLALQVQTSEGLAAGTLALPWQPSTNTLTVNKVHIIRDGKVIDVLGGGQKFTTVRRETNLEAAMLDGTLTATLQPEGLQVGDIINVATTDERVDPVMKGHVEAEFATWNGVPLQKAQARVSYPSGLKVRTQISDGLPKPRQVTGRGVTVLELTGDAVEPLLLPKNAPPRFQIGRAGEVTDFAAWADVARLMMPLYAAAATVPDSGPLRQEVERIRREAATPKQRADKALQLVQDRVRYVALLMGTGSYVPATAEETWARRFGDCKGKSALLISLLREFGIEAEAVAVNTRFGDALPTRLPMVSYFDHVIVRARLGGTDYWLDGTRSADMSLDNVEVPNFGWGLPLTEGAELVRIVPQPLNAPELVTAITLDATAGVYAPARFDAETRIRGDGGRALNLVYAKLSPAQLDQVLRQTWKNRYDYVAIDDVKYSFDKNRAELKLQMAGKATLPWDDGWFYVPESSIAYEPDFERSPGPYRDAPVAVPYPGYSTSRTTIKLPPKFAAGQRRSDLTAPVRETIAGVEYVRTATLNGDAVIVETRQRSITPEIPYSQALAASPRLKALAKEDVYLKIPAGYDATDDDLSAMEQNKPASASQFLERGLVMLHSGRFDEAIADFSEVIANDPKDVFGFANRGIAHLWKREFAQAQKDFKAAEALDARNEVLLRGRALEAELQGDLEKAVEFYSESLDADSGNAFALMRRASAYRALGDNVKALADTDQLLRKSSSVPPSLRLLRANILKERGDIPATVREADSLVAENADSDFALVAAAKIYAAVGEKQKANAAFDRALAIRPEAYIYINRAETRPPTDVAGRSADIEAALKLEPDNPDAIRLKARQLEEAGDSKAALTLYDRAVAADPENQQIVARRAVLLAKLGRTAEALKAFALVREQLNDPAAFNNLCWTKATAGVLLESALEDCREALKLSPGNAAFSDSLGMVLLRLGRLDEALAAYNDALESRQYAASLMGRAIVYARKGDMARAKADKAAAVKENPDIEQQFSDYGLTF